MSELDVSYEFVDGTDAEAAQVNQNFADIEAVVNGNLDAENLADAGITKAKIGPWFQVASGTVSQQTGIGVVTWPVPFPTTNYIVIATPYYNMASRVWVTNKTTTGVTFGFEATMPGSGGLYAIGIML